MRMAGVSITLMWMMLQVHPSKLDCCGGTRTGLDFVGISIDLPEKFMKNLLICSELPCHDG